MRVEIKMPDLATTDSEVTIVRWLAEVGQPVRLGQALLEIETDKATMEVESVASGVLSHIQIQAGERAAVGQTIAVITNEVVQAAHDALPIPQTNAHHVVQTAPVRSSPGSPTSSGVLEAPATPRISLFARNKAARGQPTVEAIQLSAIQREVARRLQHSKQTVPHFYLTTSANAERMIAVRSQAAEQNPAQPVIWDAFFVQAVAKSLQRFERMGYRFDGDRLVRRTTDAVGVAADLGGDLYVVPVEHPLALNLAQISQTVIEQVKRISRGDLVARKMAETWITISNLGAEGIESFQAIINPPETAVLAIGRIAATVQAQAGQVVIQNRVTLSLSVDHRVVNGKYAAAFLNAIVHELEAL